jgi:hypothetical protein
MTERNPSPRFPRPPFAEKLGEWWMAGAHGFKLQADIEAKLGISLGIFGTWLAGKNYPSDTFCEHLYALSELACFSPENREAVRYEYEKGRGRSA